MEEKLSLGKHVYYTKDEIPYRRRDAVVRRRGKRVYVTQLLRRYYQLEMSEGARYLYCGDPACVNPYCAQLRNGEGDYPLFLTKALNDCEGIRGSPVSFTSTPSTPSEVEMLDEAKIFVSYSPFNAGSSDEGHDIESCFSPAVTKIH